MGWRTVAAWATYDWANSAYAVCVTTVFVPIFYKDFWNQGVAGEVSSFRWGAVNSILSLVMALSAPLMGAVADSAGRRRGMLIGFAALGCLTTAALALVGQGQWLLASLVYVASGIGFAGANVFYDALIVRVASEHKRDSVSALGYSLGYIGGGLLMLINVLMVKSPGAFGLADPTAAVRASFVTVAVWWALFTVPVLIWVPRDEPTPGLGLGDAMRGGWRDMWHTLRELRLPSQRQILLFLLAYWLYIDGVDTIIKMAVDYGKSIGIQNDALILAILVTQFVGFPAALAFGFVGQRLGAKHAILAGLVAYVLITLAAWRLTAGNFIWLAISVGLVQGGVQALSRSLFSNLAPRERASQYFGLYNMLGKSAAIVGPLMMGAVGWATGDPRFGILSIMLLFISGGAILTLVRVPPTRQPGKSGASTN